jgi:hypothetical protein
MKKHIPLLLFCTISVSLYAQNKQIESLSIKIDSLQSVIAHLTEKFPLALETKIKIRKGFESLDDLKYVFSEWRCVLSIEFA